MFEFITDMDQLWTVKNQVGTMMYIKWNNVLKWSTDLWRWESVRGLSLYGNLGRLLRHLERWWDLALGEDCESGSKFFDK